MLKECDHRSLWAIDPQDEFGRGRVKTKVASVVTRDCYFRIKGVVENCAVSAIIGQRNIDGAGAGVGRNVNVVGSIRPSCVITTIQTPHHQRGKPICAQYIVKGVPSLVLK